MDFVNEALTIADEEGCHVGAEVERLAKKGSVAQQCSHEVECEVNVSAPEEKKGCDNVTGKGVSEEIGRRRHRGRVKIGSPH